MLNGGKSGSNFQWEGAGRSERLQYMKVTDDQK